MEITIERINDGVLCTFADETVVWFDDVGDAALFASQLMLVATLGSNVLDEPVPGELGEPGEPP